MNLSRTDRSTKSSGQRDTKDRFRLRGSIRKVDQFASNNFLYSRANQVLLDGSCFAISFLLAYLIRFESLPTGTDLRQYLLWLPLLVLARLAVHYLFGIYRQIWKFVSFSDAISLAESIAVVSVLLAAVRLLYPGHGEIGDWARIPLSVIALEGLLSMTGSLAIRALRRGLYAREKRSLVAFRQSAKRVLLYGAGRAGMMLRRELENSTTYEVVGFVDDDPGKLDSVIQHTRVVGSGEQLASLVEKLRVDEVIISMATASRLTLARALAKCRQTNVPAKIIPSLREILAGQVHITQLRDTRVEEVLGRERVSVVDLEDAMGPTYEGKRVLVTGAGGSIGSELVRQLSRLSPSKIAILDKDENSIYELEMDLRLRGVTLPIESQIADMRDADRLRSLFAEFRPQLVFHAAAHKHVPLMEKHPCEAVLNNVAGTKNVLDISIEANVDRFVFISSDKAVNPANVMGATKRIGELLVQGSCNSTGTRLACVRFGNVLGSRGSVVPLFERQIAEGGPVTVTHPDMNRYFMTIQEAVELILCAGTLAQDGEIFVLDMGAPRKILELAREMILLSGFEPEKDIRTRITGLRPGEKLSEELVSSTETLLQTRFAKLSVIPAEPRDPRLLFRNISNLIQAARSNDASLLLTTFAEMGLGFEPFSLRAKAATASVSLNTLPFPSVRHLEQNPNHV
jgi:FlaA1/EpsC-like NDP-sugar epimerase